MVEQRGKFSLSEKKVQKVFFFHPDITTQTFLHRHLLFFSTSLLRFLLFFSTLFDNQQKETMAPSRRRSTFFAAAASAGILALAAAASPAAALSINPGALSSFKVSGGQQLGEALQGSAQQCLDACFGVTGCNAASFCVNSAGCDGGKPASTCVWFKVDDASNPPGDASPDWQSGTVSTTQPQQQVQQQQQQVSQDAPVQQQQQPQQQQQQQPPSKTTVVVLAGGGKSPPPPSPGAKPCTSPTQSACTPVHLTQAGNPTAGWGTGQMGPPGPHIGGRRMMSK